VSASFYGKILRDGLSHNIFIMEDNNIQAKGEKHMVKKGVAAVLVIVGFIIGGAVGGYTAVNQPHMVAALDFLQQAKAELEIATPNKRGHRVEAIRLTDLAIIEVQKGMEAGERW
jgi:hypothetical protein